MANYENSVLGQLATASHLAIDRATIVIRVAVWLNAHYERILDCMIFAGYVGIGLTLAYGPPADSTAFVQRLIYGTDRRFIGWTFFIAPSVTYLVHRSWVLKFAVLAPLAFLLSGISWFIIVTPNRSWFAVVVYALLLSLMTIRYLKLIVSEYYALRSNA